MPDLQLSACLIHGAKILISRDLYVGGYEVNSNCAVSVAHEKLEVVSYYELYDEKLSQMIWEHIR
jgi:hypothetical protein